jgi:hypothetical protein
MADQDKKEYTLGGEEMTPEWKFKRNQKYLVSAKDRYEELGMSLGLRGFDLADYIARRMAKEYPGSPKAMPAHDTNPAPHAMRNNDRTGKRER